MRVLEWNLLISVGTDSIRYRWNAHFDYFQVVQESLIDMVEGSNRGVNEFYGEFTELNILINLLKTLPSMQVDEEEMSRNETF